MLSKGQVHVPIYTATVGDLTMIYTPKKGSRLREMLLFRRESHDIIQDLLKITRRNPNLNRLQHLGNVQFHYTLSVSTKQHTFVFQSILKD